MEYTPGPWMHAEGYAIGEDGGIRIFSMGDAEKAPAQVFGDTDVQAQANARLVALAPEMALVLSNLVENYNTHDDFTIKPRFRISAEIARALLSRINGQG